MAKILLGVIKSSTLWLSMSNRCLTQGLNTLRPSKSCMEQNQSLELHSYDSRPFQGSERTPQWVKTVLCSWINILGPKRDFKEKKPRSTRWSGKDASFIPFLCCKQVRITKSTMHSTPRSSHQLLLSLIPHKTLFSLTKWLTFFSKVAWGSKTLKRG